MGDKPVTEKKSVLIVDDEKDIRDIIKDLLKMSFPNIQVYESENGSDGFSKLARQRFDLLITDLRMPKVAGDKLMERMKGLKEEFKPSQILILSGYLDASMQNKRTGNIMFMLKPFSTDHLLNYLREALMLPEVEAPAKVAKAPVARKSL